MAKRLSKLHYVVLGNRIGLRCTRMAAHPYLSSDWRCQQEHILVIPYNQLRSKLYGYCPTCKSEARERAEQERKAAALRANEVAVVKARAANLSHPRNNVVIITRRPRGTKITELNFDLQEVQKARMLYFFKNPQDNKTAAIRNLMDLCQHSREHLIRKVGLSAQTVDAVEKAIEEIGEHLAGE
jgi:hypothetical protein